MQLGQYRIDGKLAEGGMGIVYRATHVLLNRPAAVKILLPEMSADRSIVDRFFNEARAASSIRHDGIVEVYDFGYSPEGLAYLVMELLEGEPLSEQLARVKRLDETTALRYTRGMVSALVAAHAKGIVHRDLKPDNTFLVADPDLPGGVRVKLLDFGIAKITEASIASVNTTNTRSVLGTPTYMSPEQCRGAGYVDHRSDLYSVGCILYEMLVGHPPFLGDGLGELLGQHWLVAPTPPRQLAPDISERAEKLILKLLEKSPADRVQSASDLLRIIGTDSNPAVMVTVPNIASHAAPTILRTPTATTLGSSSGQLVSAPGTVRRRGLVIGGVAIAVASAGLALAFIATRPRGSEPAATSAASAPMPTSAPAPTALPTTPATPPTATEPATGTAAAPANATAPATSAESATPTAPQAAPATSQTSPAPAAAALEHESTARTATAKSPTKRPTKSTKKPATKLPPITNASTHATSSDQGSGAAQFDRGD